MARTISASEAKTRFGAIMSWAVECKEDVIVESYGDPKVVIIPFEEYQKILKLRDESRRREALARLERLGEQVRARNRDLSQEQAEALANQFTTEVMREMVEEGKIAYQGQ
jgi:prevent-host-death family protein